MLEKFGGDSLSETHRNLDAYLATVEGLGTHEASANGRAAAPGNE
jgi:hypothetical protein